ncbi:unnamed protein product [Sphagnum jensenii]|uniref:NPH3 domain-containing protein n=1 Tax=Sphagnum jensenii TaxID=128206 RepID=A0ABP1B0B2_9BRYO
MPIPGWTRRHCAEEHGGGGKYIAAAITDMNPRHERRSHSRENGNHHGDHKTEPPHGRQQGQAWAEATELHHNLQVQVADISYHLHKFPLLSRSGRLNRLVFESRDTEKEPILLHDIPGGPAAFEMAARFLYHGSPEITPSNVAILRCAAEYLEMADSLNGDGGNLVMKTENYLNSVVVGSWKDSICVLKTCSDLKPWAEDLEIVRRCCESVAWKASTDPHGIRWSFSSKAGALQDAAAAAAPRDWWFNDVSALSIDIFSKLISAVNLKGMHYAMVAAAVVYYAEKWLPGLLREPTMSTTSKGKPAEKKGSFTAFKAEKDVSKLQLKHRATLQGIVSMIPPQQDAVSCSFLLRLLRVACMVNAGSLCKTDLERRIGMQLDSVLLPDLLIPAHGNSSDTLYDTDVVQHILDQYLHEQSLATIPPASPAGSVTSLTTASIKSVTTGSGTSTTEISSTNGASISGSSSTGTRNSHASISGSSSTGNNSGSSRSSSRSSFSSMMSGSSVARSDSSMTTRSSVSSMSSEESIKPPTKGFYPVEGPVRKLQYPPTIRNLKVAELMESYLEEIAKDSNLPVAKFMALIDSFSELPRDSDNCLYRTIDVYLTAHPTLTEQERNRLCRIVDCQQLSLDACMHAASNERLPLRVIVQVLFSEQVKLRNAITGTAVVHDIDLSGSSSSGHSSSRSSSDITGTTSTSTTTSSATTARGSVSSIASSLLPGGLSLKESVKVAMLEIETLRKAALEVETLQKAVLEVETLKNGLSSLEILRCDIETITNKFAELAHDYTQTTQQVEELTKIVAKHSSKSTGWSSSWKKISKPFHHKDHHDSYQYRDYGVLINKELAEHQKQAVHQMKISPPIIISPEVLKQHTRELLQETPEVVEGPVKEVTKSHKEQCKEDMDIQKEEVHKDSVDDQLKNDHPAETSDKGHIFHHKDDHHQHRHKEQQHTLTPDHQHHKGHHQLCIEDVDNVSLSSTKSHHKDGDSVSTSSSYKDNHQKDHRHRKEGSDSHGHRRHKDDHLHHNHKDHTATAGHHHSHHKSDSHHHKDSSEHQTSHHIDHDSTVSTQSGGHKEGSHNHHRHKDHYRRETSEHHSHHHKDGSDPRHHDKEGSDHHHHHQKEQHISTPTHHKDHQQKEHASSPITHNGHHHKGRSDHHHHRDHHHKEQHHRHHRHKDSDSISTTSTDSNPSNRRRHHWHS